MSDRIAGPSNEAANLPSLHNDPILVGVDWPDTSQQALRWAVGIAGDVDAKLILVHAVAPWTGIEMSIPPIDYDRYRSLVREKLDEWAESAEAVDHETRLVEEEPGTGILQVAHETDAGLIVLGAHARGDWSPPLLGSVTAKILHAAHNPVAVIPEPVPAEQRRVVIVGVDGSEASERALWWLATSDFVTDREIYVVCVFPGDAYSERPRFGAGSANDKALSSLRQLIDHVSQQTGAKITADMLIGSPAERLAEVGEEAFAVVLGKSGHSQLHQTLFGSTARAVATHSRVPVILVP